MSSFIIIGEGSAGKRHLKTIKQLEPNSEILSFSSRTFDEKQAATISHIEPKAVVIASPANMHLSHASMLIGKFDSLLVEKPLTSKLIEAVAFEETWKNYLSQIQIGYMWRYSSGLRQISKLLASNLVGDIKEVSIRCNSNLPDWRPGTDFRKSVSARKELGGGVLLELSHEIDYATRLFGKLSLVDADISYSPAAKLEVEDSANLSLKTETGTPVFIELSFWSKTEERYCLIRGNKGDLKWCLRTGVLTHLRGRKVSAIWREKYSRDNLFAEQMRDFLHGGIEELAAGFSDGLEVVKIIEKAKSLSKGKF